MPRYIHYEIIKYGQDEGAVNFVFSNYISMILSNKAFFVKCVEPSVTLIKSIIPASKRSYDPNSKIWTIDIHYWLKIKELLTLAEYIDQFVEHACLENFISGEKGKEQKKEVPKVEDFFHQVAPTSNSSLTDIISNLEIYLGVGFDKLSKTEQNSLYKKAVRKYHPDLNGGDSSKMSELNMRWQEYKNIYAPK